MPLTVRNVAPPASVQPLVRAAPALLGAAAEVGQREAEQRALQRGVGVIYNSGICAPVKTSISQLYATRP